MTFDPDESNKFYHWAKKTMVIAGAAFIYSIGVNMFMVPANVYTGGFSGLSQLLMTIFSTFFHIHVPMGIILLLLNLPVLILGYKKLGRHFIIYSMMSVFFMSFFLQVIPIVKLSDDILLNSVFGGTITATGIGITLRVGGSTGGLDIITVFLSRWKDQPVGKISFPINAVIILSAGYLFGWEKSLYTLVAQYTSSRIVDSIHTRSQKLTAMIVTDKTNDLKKEILNKLGRGVTILPATGAYSDRGKTMLLTVITRYELFELKQLISRIDRGAFTAIIPTECVYGRFRKKNYL
jgi:Uncharacterized BCR, YitT family COG1284./Uncharacterized protein conserved in bacteria (DUF2179).